jgi:hypothetical protein
LVKARAYHADLKGMRRLVIECAGQVPKNRDFLALVISVVGAGCLAALVAQGFDLGAALLVAAGFWTAVAAVFADAEDPQARRRKRRERFRSA